MLSFQNLIFYCTYNSHDEVLLHNPGKKEESLMYRFKIQIALNTKALSGSEKAIDNYMIDRAVTALRVS